MSKDKARNGSTIAKLVAGIKAADKQGRNTACFRKSDLDWAGLERLAAWGVYRSQLEGDDEVQLVGPFVLSR